jgi:ABC-type transport system involved in multi-copper enzyme maturation permease subunit
VTATFIIARHAVQESVRRRVFIVLLLLTLLFLALVVVASVKTFEGPAPFMFGSGTLIDPRQITSITSVTLLSLGAFASLFLATVLAVFRTLGAVRGDAERGLLQPLVVRPLGRQEFLLGRFVGAAAVCVAYIIALYVLVLLIVHQAGGRWPDHIIGPGLALAAAVTILVAMSLLGSVFLSATANGIAMFMLYGAGLISGLLGSNQTGLARVVVNLGPFGSSHAGSVAFDIWAGFYLAIVASLAILGCSAETCNHPRQRQSRCSDKQRLRPRTASFVVLQDLREPTPSSGASSVCLAISRSTRRSPRRGTRSDASRPRSSRTPSPATRATATTACRPSRTDQRTDSDPPVRRGPRSARASVSAPAARAAPSADANTCLCSSGVHTASSSPAHNNRASVLASSRSVFARAGVIPSKH